MIASIAFYVFSVILLGSAAMVVSARNPVHSVLFLILAFFNAAALFLIAGAEFLAMILVIVYVGAVAVLFLFVELVLVLGGWKIAPDAATLRFAPQPQDVSNTAALGRVLYTDYFLLFQTAGLVLLVAMIGAIVLTLRERKTSRHQNIQVQTSREVSETLELLNLPLGAGVKELGIYRPKVEEPPELQTDEPVIGQGSGHAAGHHAPEVR